MMNARFYDKKYRFHFQKTPPLQQWESGKCAGGSRPSCICSIKTKVRSFMGIKLMKT